MSYRIHNRNQDIWGTLVLVKFPGGPAKPPKDHYLKIDANGDTIVSPAVWERMQQGLAAGLDHGFNFVNEVHSPPSNVSLSGGLQITGFRR
jgi:hypothetical protein